MEAVQASLSQMQQMFVQRMDSYQSDLQAAAPSATIAALSAEFTTFRSFIMGALQSLQEQMCLLSQQTDSLEMRTRRKILLLHGIPESKDEDTASVIAKVVVSKLKIGEFSTADISRSHRMGRASIPERPRPILFKLHNMELRNKIWHSKTGLKGSGITLSEFLTKARHVTFTAARQKLGVNKCWTREGFVFILGPNGERHRISSLVELEKVFAPEVEKVPATVASRDQAASSKPKRGATASKK